MEWGKGIPVIKKHEFWFMDFCGNEFGSLGNLCTLFPDACVLEEIVCVCSRAYIYFLILFIFWRTTQLKGS